MSSNQLESAVILLTRATLERHQVGIYLTVAFAIPGGKLVPAVIVTQILVELLGELVYIRWVPRLGPEPESHRTAPEVHG